MEGADEKEEEYRGMYEMSLYLPYQAGYGGTSL